MKPRQSPNYPFELWGWIVVDSTHVYKIYKELMEKFNSELCKTSETRHTKTATDKYYYLWEIGGQVFTLNSSF